MNALLAAAKSAAPSSAVILTQLEEITRTLMPLAIAWHLAAAVVLIALARGWRPARRWAAVLLAAPVASAAVAALAWRNPFNGAVLGGLAIALIILGWRLGRDRVVGAAGPWWWFGVAMIGFGWLYPHFVHQRGAAFYLFAAPTGLIPCPTLSLIIGFTLLGGGLGSRAWSLLLAGVSLFYGLFGVFQLGVWLDIVLVGGATVVHAAALRRGKPTYGR